jgi:hypothetical protein
LFALKAATAAAPAENAANIGAIDFDISSNPHICLP